MSSDIFSVTLPDDPEAVEQIYSTDPMVKSILDTHLDVDDPASERLAQFAGKTVGASAAQLGIVDRETVNTTDAVEVTISGTYDG